jgi:pilus assembly protein Flp/PilA
MLGLRSTSKIQKKTMAAVPSRSTGIFDEEGLHMPGLVNRLWRDERGATATEYAMLIIFVALAIAGGATLLGSNINNLFNSLGASISGLMP